MLKKLALILSLLLVVDVSTVMAAVSSDEFNAGTQQNFKTGGDGAKSYNWYSWNTGNATYIDSNITQTDVLTLKCNTNSSGMGATSETMPAVYQLFTASFDVTTLVTSDNRANGYEGYGIVVSHNSTPNLHSYIVNYYAGTGASANSLQVNSSNGTTETGLVGPTTGSTGRYLRVSGILSGSTWTLTYYYKVNSGDSWTQEATESRSDLGTTVRVGLYVMSNNTLGTYQAQFDYFHLSTLSLYQDEFYNIPTANNIDGVISSTGTAIPFSVVQKLDSSESIPRSFGVRSSQTTTAILSTSGTTSNLWAFAPNNNGAPGTWGSYGANLLISGVTFSNSIFWAKCKGATGDTFGVDSSVSLVVTDATTSVSISYPTKRKVVPGVSVLGSAGNYYLGYDWGGGDLWKHATSSTAGDFTLTDSGGTAWSNVVYSSYTTTGNVTTLSAQLSSGPTVTTTLTKVNEGTYLVSVQLSDTVDRWLKFNKFIQGSNTNNSSTVDAYQNNTSENADAKTFQAAALHHMTNNIAISEIAGNGYDNDWCIFRWDYLTHTDWYNGAVLYRATNSIQLNYGLLSNGSTTNYTVQLQANVPRSISYVLNADIPNAQADLNEAIYSAYYDAYSGVTGRNKVEKMLWASSSQLKRIKRHILVEGSKVLVIAPAGPVYSGMISLGDFAFSSIGLGEPTTILNTLSTFHKLGPQDGAAAGGSVAGSAGNNLDGTYAVYLPFLELYAKTFLNYVPDSTAQAAYIAVADSYADAINNVKLIPDTSTRLAHYYSDTFAGPESLGFGDFEQPLSFSQENETRYRWSTELNGTGTASRVGIDGGITPHGGGYQARLYSNGASDFGRLRLMRIAVPPSKSITCTAYINIPSTYSSGGYQWSIIEQNSALSTTATTTSSDVTTSSGWIISSVTLTTNASTVYFIPAIASHGVGTTYVDDVQCVISNPTYTGLFWNLSIMPPQIKGDTLSPGTFSEVWTQLNLNALKVLLASSWTTTHQKALDAVNASYPAAYWYDSSHYQIMDDVYHPIRKTLQSSWSLFGHFIWFVTSGQKIFSDSDVLNIYAHYPFASAGGSYGNVCARGWVSNLDGSSVGGANYTALWLTDWPYSNGYYVNSGCWLWAADAWMHNSAYYAGNTSARSNILNREQLEISLGYSSHESSNAIDGTITAINGYGANVILLANSLVLSPGASNHHGAALSWTKYWPSDFSNYTVCRSTSTPVTIANAIMTISNVNTLSYTDTSGNPNKQYYYAVFVARTDTTTAKSNEATAISTPLGIFMFL